MYPDGLVCYPNIGFKKGKGNSWYKNFKIEMPTTSVAVTLSVLLMEQ